MGSIFRPVCVTALKHNLLWKSEHRLLNMNTVHHFIHKLNLKLYYKKRKKNAYTVNTSRNSATLFGSELV